MECRGVGSESDSYFRFVFDYNGPSNLLRAIVVDNGVELVNTTIAWPSAQFDWILERRGGIAYLKWKATTTTITTVTTVASVAIPSFTGPAELKIGAEASSADVWARRLIYYVVSFDYADDII